MLLGIACCGVTHSSYIGKNSVTAALGHPYFLTFNYDGPKETVDYLYNYSARMVSPWKETTPGSFQIWTGCSLQKSQNWMQEHIP